MGVGSLVQASSHGGCGKAGISLPGIVFFRTYAEEASHHAILLTGGPNSALLSAFREPPICRRLVMGSPKLTAAARAVLVRVIVCFMCSHSRRSYIAPSSSNYSSLLSFDSIHLKDWEKLRRIILASAKGFTIGAGLALFSILARFATKKDTRLPEEAVVTNREAIFLALKDTLRYGFFLGTFSGTSVDEIILALGGHRSHVLFLLTARWRALLAGAIAGPSILLTGLQSQHTSLAIYILMRAAVLASRCGIKSERFGGICKPLTWKYGDIFLMCLSSSQILYGVVLNMVVFLHIKVREFAFLYKSFLNKHGGKDTVILQGVKELASDLPFTNLEAIEKHYRAMGVDMQLDPNMKIPCSIVHGSQSCGGHVLSFLLQAYKRALPVYLPVYLIPALLVHRQGLLKRPNSILSKGLFALQDQVCSCLCIALLPGCGRVCSLGYLKDATYRWWLWERSQLGLH